MKVSKQATKAALHRWTAALHELESIEAAIQAAYDIDCNPRLEEARKIIEQLVSMIDDVSGYIGKPSGLFRLWLDRARAFVKESDSQETKK